MEMLQHAAHVHCQQVRRLGRRSAHEALREYQSLDSKDGGELRGMWLLSLFFNLPGDCMKGLPLFDEPMAC